MNNLIKEFEIIGLYGYKDICIHFKNPIIIGIGENGIGKTTILESLFYVLTGSYTKLLDIEFSCIRIRIDEEVYILKRDNLEDYESLRISNKLYNKINLNPKGEKAIESITRLVSVLQKMNIRIMYFPASRIIEGTYYYERDSHGVNSDGRTRDGLTVMQSVKFQIEQLADKHSLNSIKTFCDVCNKYLNDKQFVYNDYSKTIRLYRSINGNTLIEPKSIVNLDELSSGELQIVLIFSTLFLNIEMPDVILIDEPERSLSINWQEHLIPDMLGCCNCQLLIAMTHSPFVFNSQLKSYAVGMNDFLRKT